MSVRRTCWKTDQYLAGWGEGSIAALPFACQGTAARLFLAQHDWKGNTQVPMYEDRYEPGDGWVAGIDFDPSDQDEMEVMRVVWEKEKYDKIAALEREIEVLRRALSAKVSECHECKKTAVCEAFSGEFFCGSCLNEIKYEAEMHARDADYIWGDQ